jgi:hypothetical protein
MFESNGFRASLRQKELIAEIAPVVPNCTKCRAVMQLSDIYPHPRFPRVEIVSFKCECGVEEKRVVPHSIQHG